MIKFRVMIPMFLSLFAGCSREEPSPESIIREIEGLGGFVVKDDSENVIFIKLSSCNVSHTMITQLPRFEHIRYLYLELTDIKDEDLEYVGKITSLEVLNINQTQTTDEGLFFLLPLTHLKQLNMSHYSLTRPLPEDFKKATIDDILSGNIKINTENLYGEGVKALIKKYPELKIELWGALPDRHGK